MIFFYKLFFIFISMNTQKWNLCDVFGLLFIIIITSIYEHHHRLWSSSMTIFYNHDRNFFNYNQTKCVNQIKLYVRPMHLCHLPCSLARSLALMVPTETTTTTTTTTPSTTMYINHSTTEQKGKRLENALAKSLQALSGQKIPTLKRGDVARYYPSSGNVYRILYYHNTK